MQHSKIKQGLGLLFIAALIAGCSKSEAPKTSQETSAPAPTAQNSDKKTLVIGFSVGNYIDQFREGVKPILEKEGYTIDIKQFSQGARVINAATVNGEVDASVVQTRAFLDGYNTQNNTNIIAIADNPNPPQTLRSKKHTSLDEVKDGMTVAIPNDPINGERAARNLEELGWVKVKPNTTPLNFSAANDLEPGKFKLIIKEADSAQGLRLLDDVDFALINGNHVAGAGLKFSDGLFVEKTPLRHRVTLTIDAKNADTQWAKDLKAAYESKEFADYIRAQPAYSEYVEPDAWQKYPK